jgi:hypothetical protein
VSVEFEREEEVAEQVKRQLADMRNPLSPQQSVLFDERGEYDLAEQAYQQAINSGHPEVAPKALGNLRGLPMRSTVRESGGAGRRL